MTTSIEIRHVFVQGGSTHVIETHVLKQNKCFSHEILVYFIVGYFYKRSPVY